MGFKLLAGMYASICIVVDDNGGVVKAGEAMPMALQKRHATRPPHQTGRFVPLAQVLGRKMPAVGRGASEASGGFAKAAVKPFS